MRLFIGIPLPDHLQEQIQTLIGRFDTRLDSRVRWIQPGNAHLTLKFLGDTTEEVVEDLATALSTIDSPAFDISFDTCGCYPNDTVPRVVWVALNTGADACTALAHTVENTVVALGFKANTHPFTPHLTLGRVKKPAHDNWAACFREADTQGWPDFHADTFVLWKSDLTPDGPIYTALKEFRLNTSANARQRNTDKTDA